MQISYISADTSNSKLAKKFESWLHEKKYFNDGNYEFEQL